MDFLHEVTPPQWRDTLEGWVLMHHRTLQNAYARVRHHAGRRQHWD